MSAQPADGLPLAKFEVDIRVSDEVAAGRVIANSWTWDVPDGFYMGVIGDVDRPPRLIIEVEVLVP